MVLKFVWQRCSILFSTKGIQEFAKTGAIPAGIYKSANKLLYVSQTRAITVYLYLFLQERNV